jgi:uncharacterized protein (TIGR03118 family)
VSGVRVLATAIKTQPQENVMNRFRNLLLPIAAVALLGAGITLAEAAATRYQQTNLVSDGTIAAAHVDSNLVNPWGIVFNPTAFVWVADNVTGRSTLYDGAGNPAPPPPAPQPLVVQIPSGNNVYDPPGTPTGIVFNASNDFQVTNGASSGASRFIFATQDGIIAGWAPTVDGTHALFATQTPGAVYTGLAIAGNGSGNFLYAADFLGGKIDVFDKTFTPVGTSGGFKDPALPAGFAPFNIQAIQGDLYVMYAFHEPGDDEETAGPGLGIVNVFDANGNLIRRVATRGKLNAPWGVALAPASFGTFAGRLLVGNFGDGTINAYDAHNGTFKGQLRDVSGKPLKIDGLWGLAFGNGVAGQPTSTLFFAAGPDEETHGLYGSITAVPGAHGDAEDGED